VPEAGVAAVVEIVTGVGAPGTAGVVLKDNGVADRPATTGTETVQATAVVVPEVKVATMLGVVLPPAVTVAVLGLQAIE
jgi:hypothetical protein